MATKTAKKKSSSSSSRSNNRSSSSSKSRSNSSSRSGGSGSKNSPTSRSGSQSRSRANGSPTSRSGSSSRSQEQEQMRGSLLHKFFLDELKDVYSAEKQLLKGLNKMAKNATTEELRSAFEEHKVQTEGQIERLEQVFETLGVRAQGKKCEAMEGLIKEVESVLEDTQDDTMTRDVALIMGAQKAEHYEIASYGGLVQLAKTMGHTEVAELLAETLEEEKQTDELLTQIAENNVNMQATTESEGDEDTEEEGDEEMEEEETEEEEE